MPADLTSPRSARVTEVRHLHDRRHRAERGAFVVEGPQAVREALQSAKRGGVAAPTTVPGAVLELYATESAADRHPEFLDQARIQGARVAVATDEVLAAMSETRNPQGVVAVCALVTRSIDDVVASLPAEAPLIVVLDRVSDPGNAGTIIRTADAMGVDAVILTQGSVDPHNGKCVRSTAGSIFHMPVCPDVPPGDVLDILATAGVRFVVADAHAEHSIDGATELLSGSTAWVFGSEAHGVDAFWREASAATVRIPMAGEVESLNLAASAAICLYATSRARAGT